METKQHHKQEGMFLQEKNLMEFGNLVKKIYI